jgi:hypothetical protein
MKSINIIAGAVIAVLICGLFQSCKEDPVTSTCPQGHYCGATGTVSGTIVAQNGRTPIPSVTIKVQTSYVNVPSTMTDTAGKFLLSGIPIGQQTIIAEKGVFRATLNVAVTQGDTARTQPTPIVPQGLLGYVPGLFDMIEAIVRDSLGYSMTLLTPSSLRDSATLARYRAIFLNCGMQMGTLDSAFIKQLRNYVAAGGSTYISDLVQPLVRAMFPRDVYGQQSGASQTVIARVVDADLRGFIKKDSVRIVYDLSGWATIDSVSSVPTVLLHGSYLVNGTRKTSPLAIRISSGTGRVVYTTFHNEANVTTDAVKVLTFFLFAL